MFLGHTGESRYPKRCNSREGGNLKNTWMPAFASMTKVKDFLGYKNEIKRTVAS